MGPITLGQGAVMVAAAENDASMLELTLEVDLDSEPIAGCVRSPEGDAYPFVGWLGLTVALEKVRRPGAAGTARKSTSRAPLTRAEREVAGLVCEGLTNRQAADRLGVSPRTIQGHLLRIFRKFDVSSRTQLAAAYLRGDADVAPFGSQAETQTPGTDSSKPRSNEHGQ